MNTLLANVHAFYRATSDDLGTDLRTLVTTFTPAVVATYTAGYVVGEYVFRLRDRYINR